MSEITETLLNKKLDSYGTNLKDYVADKEITVTITLSEYRELVSNDATRRASIDEANKDKYERNRENERLKKENNALEMKLFEYRKKFGELETEELEFK